MLITVAGKGALPSGALEEEAITEEVAVVMKVLSLV